MAKSVGLIGTVIGKLGNAVGYRIKDSNNKMSQGFRVYQPTVSNPRTYGQAVQRARMKPINTFYRALKSIIDRGFEGKAYGNQCRLEFLRLAMQNFNGPYVPKGFNGLVPGPFTIANGSLPELVTNLYYSNGHVGFGLVVPASTTITSLGDVSTALIGKYKWLETGDQLTCVSVNNSNGVNIVNVISVVLDPDSAEVIDIFSGNMGQEGNTLQFNTGSNVLAAAVILSREGDDGQHLRSKAVMTVDDNIIAQYFTDDAQAAAVASYMNADGTTDWPEVRIAAADVAQLVTLDVNDTITEAAVDAGTQALGFVTSSGETGLFYITSGENKVLVQPNGNKLTVEAQGVRSDVTLLANYAGLAVEYSSAYGSL